MEYLPEAAVSSRGKIICCECGTLIDPNPANMCVGCIRTRVDITEGIPKQGSLSFCKQCERYLQPPNAWVSASLESQELLAICLKRLKGLKEVRLVDASFIWTEPHSKRIKVKLTVQKEVLGSTVLQQSFVLELVVQGQMCPDCHRVEAKDFWKACTQVRQKTSHKKTFFYLEQLILKHDMADNTLNIKQNHDGLDFYYAQKQDARRLVDYLMTVVPMRYQTSQTLISHDVHNNTYNYKYTFSVELAPVCRDHVVCLPPKVAQSLGNLGQIVICYRVSQNLHFIDPHTCRFAELSSAAYWRTPFTALCEPRQLVEYLVLEVEHVPDENRAAPALGAKVSSKHVLSELWLAKMSEVGGERQYNCRTHLGHLLKPGDSVLGFDVTTCNLNNAYFDKIPSDKLPDVVVVKKKYASRAYRNRKRQWRLRHLNMTREETESVDRDYAGFLEDLEEDTELRQNVDIYRDASKHQLPVDVDDTEEGEAPQVSLAEMLEDLQLDATGGEGAAMQE